MINLVELRNSRSCKRNIRGMCSGVVNKPANSYKSNI
nr:MAG TPA: hypothetical protein [Caudoviricetes sp.]